MDEQQRHATSIIDRRTPAGARLRRGLPLALAGCCVAAAVALALFASQAPRATGQAAPTPTTYETVGPLPTYTPPLDTTLNVPGGALVPPNGTATFLGTQGYALPLQPSGPVVLRVHNGGPLPASVEYDGLTLTISGGSAYPPNAAVQVAVPGAACAPIDGDPARIGCTPVLGGPSAEVTFTTTAEPPPTFPSQFTFPVRTFQAMVVGDSDTLPPAATESIFLPRAAPPASAATTNSAIALDVVNDGVDAVGITDDGSALTISAPDGDLLTTSGLIPYNVGPSNLQPCSLAGAAANVVVCDHSGGVSFGGRVSVAAVPAQASGALPQAQPLYLGDSATFAAPSAGGTNPGPVVTVQYPGDEPLLYEFLPHTSANAVLLTWDGTTLTVAGPAIGSVYLDCDPRQAAGRDQATSSDSCATVAGQPLLVTVRTSLPEMPHPGGRPPALPSWQAHIVAAPASAAVGDTLSFSGMAAAQYAGTSGGPFTYVWDWGDGTLSEGQDATHAYADAGTYAVTLIVFDQHDGTTQTVATTVTVASAGR